LLIKEAAVGGDHGDTDDGQLLAVLGRHLRNGDIETAPQPFDKAFNDFPLVFERKDGVEINLSTLQSA
jgi:ADP-ribosylglycohydrolase